MLVRILTLICIVCVHNIICSLPCMEREREQHLITSTKVLNTLIASVFILEEMDSVFLVCVGIMAI